MNSIVDVLASQGVIPLFCDTDPVRATKILNSCHKAGVKLIEFTIRAPQAIDVFAELLRYASENVPDMILGVGSVMDRAAAVKTIEADAKFIVSPAFDAKVCQVAKENNIPYVPGCYSPTEMHHAMQSGAAMCKLFPAGAIDGPGFVKAILGPMPTLQIMATGGVSPTRENLSKWFASGVTCVGMGSKLINTAKLNTDTDFENLENQITELLALVAEIKG
ncbi:MAG: bifunctional 4-hydroxy-2-oxoglutarate aldolase/2-dehydro-3-deoxy-phosphogluconate aldolase [Phycisphaerae bacterium]|nr:bifunctional 4-hydroxy-2-oxoglutarate aldolase/2-dehydro-3-deoxy-phosphogluconate aldolase [Phycisphaerae bacterium]